jgi:hypothetical protein
MIMNYLVKPQLPKFKSGLEELVDKYVNRGMKNKNPISTIKQIYNSIINRLQVYVVKK